MITYLFFYHDTTYLNVDRAQMNRKLFAALVRRIDAIDQSYRE